MLPQFFLVTHLLYLCVTQTILHIVVSFVFPGGWQRLPRIGRVHMISLEVSLTRGALIKLAVPILKHFVVLDNLFVVEQALLFVCASTGNKLLEFWRDADRGTSFPRKTELWGWLPLRKSVLVVIGIRPGNLVSKVVRAGSNIGIRIISHQGVCQLTVIVSITRAPLSQSKRVTALFINKVDSFPLACCFRLRHEISYLFQRFMGTRARCVLHQPVMVLQASSKETPLTLILTHEHSLMRSLH